MGIMEHPQYTLHSGGAVGADLAWASIGKESGLPLSVKHWTPQDYEDLPQTSKSLITGVFLNAAQVLRRPTSFKGINLVMRNYFQSYHCEALYAISTIIPSGGFDRGYQNKSGKEVVAGGTGWTVEMAIQMGKPVYVFDQAYELWFMWEKEIGQFMSTNNVVPTLTHQFAGIGTRNILPCGLQAIRDVYQKTLTHETT